MALVREEVVTAANERHENVSSEEEGQIIEEDDVEMNGSTINR